METNRRYKLNQEVYVLGRFENGLPHIYKGKICGVVGGCGVYDFIYQVQTSVTLFFRFPDAIFLSLDEIRESISDLVVD